MQNCRVIARAAALCACVLALCLASRVAPSHAALAGSACPAPEVNVTAIGGGKTKIAVLSSCRVGEVVSTTYAGVTLLNRFDGEGRGSVLVDCFAGTSEAVTLLFEDGTRVVRAPVTDDMAQLSKVAIVWTSSVNLDLHAFEYAARAGDKGHVWSGNPSASEAASLSEAQGYLSSVSQGEELGSHIEVYTFRHRSGERSGAVKLAVDFASRGGFATDDFCGDKRFAEIRFKAYVFDRGGATKVFNLEFASLPCGSVVDAASRLNSRLIPALVLKGVG